MSGGPFKKVGQKLRDGLPLVEEGYNDAEEMLLDWIWIELKEESPDKDAVVNMDLNDLYELIQSGPILMRITIYCWIS